MLELRTERERIDALDAYWRAANYLGAAQLYLYDNVLLREPLLPEHIKERPIGHWGTQPGLNLIYAHLNRLISDTEANVLLVVGPGHGAPAILANLYLEGTFAEVEPRFTFGKDGITAFVRSFSWPGGNPSHLTAQIPGTLHEGGELGYALSHAYGAAFDNPDLIVACVVGDGEAETGPLAASWQANRLLDPASSGAVLPIVHANGYKLSGPTVIGRMSNDEIRAYFEGLGYVPVMVDAQRIETMHVDLWDAFDTAYQQIREIQRTARFEGYVTAPRWPVIVLRSIKGMTGPVEVDCVQNAGTFHSHGLPLADPKRDLSHLSQLERWLRSYAPDELFDAAAKPVERVLDTLPRTDLRMGRNRQSNGGTLLAPLDLPPASLYATDLTVPGSQPVSATNRLGVYLAEVFKRNESSQNFRIFSPDELISNKLDAVFESTERAFVWPLLPSDEYFARDGRIAELLSEHLCEGLLEGYVLSGRHGMHVCYEGFAPIFDSMVHQYAKWLKVARETPWRAPVASLNLLLTSHLWRQDHNGYSHQGPGLIDSVLWNKADVVRVYLPPDANTLLATAEHCLQSRGLINLVIAGKNEMPQWLDSRAALQHCRDGMSVWQWASTGAHSPDVILAACGDTPTLEALAAVTIARELVPDLRIRFVNVLDLLTLTSPADHPHGASEARFVETFGTDLDVVLAFHGYPRVIHELIHHRPNPSRFHVRGYQEEGTTTTPFDMVVRNAMSRFHLFEELVRRVPRLQDRVAEVERFVSERLREHRSYIDSYGMDLPEVRAWRWTA
ncbi:MAG: phosphoketolase family protein [Vulcanimicrobiaceae bacterium]